MATWRKSAVRLSGSSVRPAYPGFMVMKTPQVGTNFTSFPCTHAIPLRLLYREHHIIFIDEMYEPYQSHAALHQWRRHAVSNRVRMKMGVKDSNNNNSIAMIQDMHVESY